MYPHLWLLYNVEVIHLNLKKYIFLKPKIDDILNTFLPCLDVQVHKSTMPLDGIFRT